MKGRKSFVSIRGSGKAANKRLLQVNSYNMAQMKHNNDDLESPEQDVFVTRSSMIRTARSCRKRGDVVSGSVIFGLVYPIIEQLYYGKTLDKKSKTLLSESERALSVVRVKWKPDIIGINTFKAVLWRKEGFELGSRVPSVSYQLDRDMVMWNYLLNGMGKVFFGFGLASFLIAFLMVLIFGKGSPAFYSSCTIVMVVLVLFVIDFRRISNKSFRNQCCWGIHTLLQRYDIVRVLFRSVIPEEYDIVELERYSIWLDNIKTLHKWGLTFGIHKSLLDILDKMIGSLNPDTRNLAIARIAFLRDFILDVAESSKPHGHEKLHFE